MLKRLLHSLVGFNECIEGIWVEVMRETSVNRQPTFRYEESCVVEVRERVVFSFFFLFLIALLTDDKSCEGAIHRVIRHLAWREDRRRCQETDVGNTRNMFFSMYSGL